MQQLISKKKEPAIGGIRRVKYSTRFGEGILSWQEGELLAHSLPGAAPEKLSGIAPEAAEPQTASENLFTCTLESYFHGEQVSFPLGDIPLEQLFTTPFQLDVITALAAVPYGHTTSYGELAAKAGHPQAHRAVGNLMAANPLPLIIPCHRVLKSDGSLGRFSAGDEWKPRLLELEGIR
ncbi:MAG: methylated-DNA--[protein]-cysteine S-methyltransferase [Thermoleophilia bacterium]